MIELGIQFDDLIYSFRPSCSFPTGDINVHAKSQNWLRSDWKKVENEWLFDSCITLTPGPVTPNLLHSQWTSL